MKITHKVENKETVKLKCAYTVHTIVGKCESFCVIRI